jgi:glutamate N-acetyltransferase/amino-acid N-acetyltransferase
MAVNLHPPARLAAVPGIRLGCAEAAIKKAGRRDLLLIELAEGTTVAGVFTRNAFCAAPVTICRQQLAGGAPVRGLLINSGNANAGTGSAGMRAAQATVAAAAEALGGEVLPFSTGVIGVPLPENRVVAALPAAVRDLREDGWLDAAHAIMTTDTIAKGASRVIDIDGRPVSLTGIVKGAGMICPDMATLLAFIGTDAVVPAEALDIALRAAVDVSFNAITVDGDTSTNDSLMLMATGAAGHAPLGPEHPAWGLFVETLTELCIELAQAVVRDGEGATRLVTVEVHAARDRNEARAVAYTVAHSPLVKTALFAGDANWGRILAAVGRSGVPGLDLNGVNISVDEVALIRGGEPAPTYSEDQGSAVFARPEFAIRISLGRGDAQARLWTCDFSYDYVKINAEYRT